MKPSICVLLLLAAMPRLWAQAPADAPKKTDEYFAITAVNYDEKTQRVIAEGNTALPEGTVLVGAFLKEASAAGYARTVVGKDKKFTIAFDARSSTFCPGKYSIQITFRKEEQNPQVLEVVGNAEIPPYTYATQIGDEKEQKEFKEQAHKKLLDIMHELGRLYTELHQFAGFTIESAVVIERKYKGVLPEEDKDRLFKEMDKFTTDNWEPRLRVASQDFKDYRDQIAGGVLPDVERDIDQLIILMNGWYFGFWGDVCKKLKLDPPVRIGSAPAPRFELESNIDMVVMRVYKGLEVTSREEKELWSVSYVQSPERGEYKNGTYESYASKFRVSLPNDNWVFSFEMINPAVRLRIIPKNPDEAKKVAMAVEIKDFPEAKGVEDLNHICEVFNSERWQGYKRIEGKTFKANDPTMPGGVRPGYEIICLSDDAKSGGKYKVCDHALYCRWLKRTYSVLCMADVDWYSNYPKEFEAVIKSFAVLDDPKMLEKAHQEEKDKEKKAEDAAHQKGGDKEHK